MTLDDIIQDMHGLQIELDQFENRYGFLSADFFNLYQTGTVEQTCDFISWVAYYAAKLHREADYHIAKDAHLAELRRECDTGMLKLKPREKHYQSKENERMSHFHNYTELIYSLPEYYPIIQSSTLTLMSIGAALAKLEGHLLFEHDMTLIVWELIDFRGGQICGYSYQLRQADTVVVWYDALEHPTLDPAQPNYPHHKHVPPDIQHHMLPVSHMSFNKPNLPFLGEEVMRMVQG